MDTVTFSNNVTIERPISHASWPRRTRGEPSIGVTMQSDYCKSTQHSNSKDKAATTLREHTPKELRLIREAINQVPSDQLDTMRHEARQKIEEEGAAKCNRTYNEEDLEEKFDPETESNFQTTTETMLKFGHHGRKGRIIREFFGGGVCDGPFPGSQSENGVHAAEGFYKDQRPLGGLWRMQKPMPYTDEGRRFAR